MDKQIEKKIEGQVGKNVAGKIKKEMDKEIEKEVAKEVKKVEGDARKEVVREVAKEVKKVEKEAKEEVAREVAKEVDKVEKEIRKEVEELFRVKLYKQAVGSARKFNNEFKNQMVVGVTAAFAFLIALSWREPIQLGVNNLILHFGLKGGGIYLQLLSALIVTLLGVLVLMVVSSWKSNDEEN
jgi:hypothetical protein